MQALGYATQFYPLPVQHALEDVPTIFCEGDQVYDPNLANRLINAAQRYLIAQLWNKIQI
ncbi:MAG: hypothetical protein CMH03_02910 [Marinovum sp.]|nr:hypothetical protein [Marinovum sp.]